MSQLLRLRLDQFFSNLYLHKCFKCLFCRSYSFDGNIPEFVISYGVITSKDSSQYLHNHIGVCISIGTKSVSLRTSCHLCATISSFVKLIPSGATTHFSSISSFLCTIAIIVPVNFLLLHPHLNQC